MAIILDIVSMLLSIFKKHQDEIIKSNGAGKSDPPAPSV